jgi:NAD(P)-dependent dehydrogenase (short-subunit alcohol dehydrogenase family)
VFILVNNAGILRLATFDRVTEADVDANFLTNFKRVFFLTKKLGTKRGYSVAAEALSFSSCLRSRRPRRSSRGGSFA